MGLRAKADAYLNERKSAVIGELQSNDFRNPFSHEEWLIGSLLRDSIGDLNRQKKILDEYRTFMTSVDAARERPSLKDIERMVLHFISAIITASPVCMYILRNGKFIIGDAGKSEKDTVAELPGEIAKSFSIWDKRYTKRYADCLPGASAEELARHDGSRITYVLVSHAVQAIIYTGKKTNGEPYDDEDLLRLSFVAALAGLMLDAEKKTPESAIRASRAEHYERLLLAGYEGDASIARAFSQTASAAGIKRYVLLRRNGNGKLVPFDSTTAAIPQGFNLKLFGNFKSVNPKHTSPLPFTYVVKKGSRTMTERTFWFIPVVVDGRLVGALLVFELKVKADALPEPVKAALIRIQRCLSAIYSHFPKPKRRKKAVPKKKPRRKKRATAKNKKRKYAKRRKKRAGRPALKKKAVIRRKKRAVKKTKKSKGRKKLRAGKAKSAKIVKKRSSKKAKSKRAAGKKKVKRVSPRKRTKTVLPPAAPPA
ncbi:MAG: hypothetical protein HZC28_05320 [Spirochaetes bacterium]|nr:hypothetical protein [Spirochaetota bacterium]